MTHNNEENLKNILEKVQGLKESEISGNVYWYFGPKFLDQIFGPEFWVGFCIDMWTWQRWRTKIYLERWTWVFSSICNDINRRIDFSRIGFLEQDFNLNSTFENHKKSWKFLEDRFQFISYRSSSKYFRIYFTVISGPGHR